MQLLDPLPEVFRAIVYELVELAGSGGSWKLRGVYHTFAAEIAHDTFDKQLVKAFKNASDSRIMKECVNRYLVARLQHQLDANKRILRKLGKVGGGLSQSPVSPAKTTLELLRMIYVQPSTAVLEAVQSRTRFVAVPKTATCPIIDGVSLD
jgi:predicted Ser/Thr protein kinase